MMLPRMITHGVVREGELDLEALATELADERDAVNGAIFWDLAFLVSGRFQGTLQAP